MQSINFAKGYKTYAINGDESNVIRVNLADPNIIRRVGEMLDALDEFMSTVPENGNAEDIFGSFDKLLKEKLDYAFGKGTAHAVFGDMNVLAVANDEGECVFETFINAFLPIIQSDIEAAGQVQQRHISDMVDSEKLDNIAAKIKGSAK